MTPNKEVSGSEYAPPSGSVLVLVRGQYLGIRDDVAAMLNIREKVRTARYRYRNEANQITWVHDRLQGLTPNEKAHVPLDARRLHQTRSNATMGR